MGDALTRLGDTTAARAELERALELCGARFPRALLEDTADMKELHA
jgi:predicted RNA polymerase sigma factor